MITVFTVLPWLYLATAAGLGLIVGSFLNVVIYRLPVMMERQWAAECAHWQREQASAQHDAPLPRVLAEGSVVAAEPGIGNDAGAAEEPGAGDDPTCEASASNTVDEPFNLSTPPSTCPNCQRRVRAIENIPVISWIALGGRCRGCKEPISIRYPLVELLTAGLTVAVAWRFGPGVEAAAAIVLTWFLIALSGIDIDTQLLPDSLTLPLLWLGLTLSLFQPAGAQVLFISPSDAIVGALAGYLSLWSVYHAFRLTTGKEGMGYGDFKLLAALGAWLGWQVLPLLVLIAAGVGAVFGLLMIVTKRQQRGATMPFGQWLAGAGWIVMMGGDELFNTYLRLAGL